MIWGRLARYQGRQGDAFPLIKTLAENLGLSEYQVKSGLKELREFGLITSNSRGRHRSLVYEFVWNEWAEEGQKKGEVKSRKTFGPDGTIVDF